MTHLGARCKLLDWAADGPSPASGLASRAMTPTPQVTGPLEGLAAPPSLPALELAAHGYVEEEFFIAGAEFFDE